MNNEKASNVKRGGENMELQSAKRFMKLVWKILEVARNKGPIS